MSGLTMMLGGGHLLVSFVVPAAIVGLTVWFVLAIQKDGSVPVRVSQTDEAIEIARQRLARGEIEAGEYNRLVTELTRTA